MPRPFSNQECPQDPRDEPASELLARIRTTREAAGQKKPRKKSTRRKLAAS